MKNLKYILFIMICSGANYDVLAQAVTKSFNGSVSGAVCPKIGVQYEVSRPSGFGSCQVNWTATNGLVTSQSGSTAIINWNDTPGATGTVTATFSNCGTGNEGNNGVSRSLSELILSVKDQPWGSFNNSVNIDYCTPPQINLSVPRMFVQGTGGIAQPPQQEVIYSWTIPAGWRAVSGGTGVINISVNFISIEPINCAVPGTVRVEGTINDRCGAAGVSASATISLNGANPVLTMGPQAGYFGGTACNTTPVTFYATTNVALGCISSYSWTYPSSWTFYSQSGNSITLQPSGSPSDSGPIQATANMSCGSSILSGTYTPPYTSPILTGPDLVCTSGAFSVQNSSGASFTWSSSNTSIATVNSSGIVTKVGSASGQVTVTATPPCAAPAITKIIWVGKPGVPITNPPGYPTYQMTLGQMRLISVTSAPGAASNQYNWTITGSIQNISGSPAPACTVEAYSLGFGQYKAYSQNACGTSPAGGGAVNVSSGGGGPLGPALLVTPNPTADELVVDSEPTDEKDGSMELLLLNSNQEKVFHLAEARLPVSIPVSNLPEGTYYLMVITGKNKSVHRVLIEK